MKKIISNPMLRALFLIAIYSSYSYTTANAQVNRISCDTYVADVDQDGTDDFIKVINGTNITLYKSDWDVTQIMSGSAEVGGEVDRLITGSFWNSNFNIIAVLKSGRKVGYEFDPRSERLRVVSSNLLVNISKDTHTVVGNFDGDPTDEILAYSYYGDFEFLDFVDESLNFSPQIYQFSNFSTHIRRGNLVNLDLKGKIILGGEFGQSTDRTDLLFIDRRTGEIHKYSSAEKDGFYEFWFAYKTTNPRIDIRTQDFTIAKVNKDERDDLIIRDRATGQYTFYDIYSPPEKLSHISSGQLPNTKGPAKLVRHRDKRKQRENVLFVQGDFVTLTGAATTPETEEQTYWWAYTSDKICQPPTSENSQFISLKNIYDLCPTWAGSGDHEFASNGPHVRASVELNVSDDKKSIVGSVRFYARETAADWTDVRGNWTETVFDAPDGKEIKEISSYRSSTFDEVLSGGGLHVLKPSSDLSPVTEMALIGDTGGSDASIDNNCSDDTKVKSIKFKQIHIDYE